MFKFRPTGPRTFLEKGLNIQLRNHRPQIRSRFSKAKLASPREEQEKSVNEAESEHPLNARDILGPPVWSINSLLPNPNDPPSEEITPEKLHHLLRLSALPLPKDAAEEASMLNTLHDQLHFVKDIQSVNTEGVKPLQSIRDETEEGIRQITIGMEELKDALGKEDVVGRVTRKPRRRKEVVDGKGVEDWDVLGPAEEKVNGPRGKFFVVRSGKDKNPEKDQQ